MVKLGISRVERQFKVEGQEQFFQGTVEENYVREGIEIFKIVYDDGDFEEVTGDKLSDLLILEDVQAVQGDAILETMPSPKGRGRPRKITETIKIKKPSGPMGMMLGFNRVSCALTIKSIKETSTSVGCRLKAGDQILKINGTVPTSKEDFLRALQAVQPHQEIVFEVLRRKTETETMDSARKSHRVAETGRRVYYGNLLNGNPDDSPIYVETSEDQGLQPSRSSRKATYQDMVLEALTELRDKKGSSLISIRKWIHQNYPETKTKAKASFNYLSLKALNKLVSENILEKDRVVFQMTPSYLASLKREAQLEAARSGGNVAAMMSDTTLGSTSPPRGRGRPKKNTKQRSAETEMPNPGGKSSRGRGRPRLTLEERKLREAEKLKQKTRKRGRPPLDEQERKRREEEAAKKPKHSGRGRPKLTAAEKELRAEIRLKQNRFWKR